MKNSRLFVAESAKPFESLIEMSAAYNNLTREYGKTLKGEPRRKLLDKADEFVLRGRETGTLLEDPDERWDAQNMLNFWAKVLYRYRGMPEEEPPTAALSAFGSPARAKFETNRVPFQAPPEPDAYVGRKSFLADLKQQLLTGRNIALYSSPGTGKTLIATKLAYDPELRKKYPDGVLWARLGEQPEVSSILRSWCKALNVSSNEGDWLDQELAGKIIRQALGRRRMLLVIDDAWQLDVVMSLKLGGPSCAHVVTTYLRSVALAFDAQGAVTVRGFSPSDGLRLLAQRVPKAVQEQKKEAEDLVEALDNSPLALSLLANYYALQMPRSRRPDLKELLRQLLENKKVIEAERSSGSSKSSGDEVRTPSSLLAAIGWCFDRLTDDEKYVLQAFSFFPPKPNSFSGVAARKITGEHRKGIETLLDRGLLERTSRDRYSLHRAVSDFLKRQLHSRADHTPEQRMVHFFVELVQTQATNLQVLEQEEKNILAALETAYAQDMWKSIVEGTNALFGYFDRQGLYGLAKNTLHRAREAAEKSNDERSLAAILLKLGEIEEKRSDYPEAKEHFQASLDLAKKVKAHDVSASALQGLGVVAMAGAKYPEAKGYLNQALDLARKIRNADIQCAVETRLGWVERGLGKFKQSRKLTEHALKLARSNHYIRQVAELELSMGVLNFFEKKYERAKKHDREGLRYAEKAQDKRLQCALHQALGGTEMELKNFDEAEAHLMKSLHLSMEIGHRWYNGVIWKEIGELKMKQQLPNAASSAFQKAVELAREVNSSELMGLSLYGLAQVAAVQQNYAEARLQGQTSLNIFQSFGYYKQKEVNAWLKSIQGHTSNKAREHN
jgi:tetratricopeptide (TPR) repeat protein